MLLYLPKKKGNPPHSKYVCTVDNIIGIETSIVDKVSIIDLSFI